jgi:hypothetical protein
MVTHTYTHSRELKASDEGSGMGEL